MNEFDYDEESETLHVNFPELRENFSLWLKEAKGVDISPWSLELFDNEEWFLEFTGLVG